VSWLQVECSPQMGQAATYCVTIQIVTVKMSAENATFPLRYWRSRSHHHQYTLVVTVPKMYLKVAVVVLRWRKLVYDVISQKTCDVMYSATRVHDVTSRACDVTCSTPDYMTSLHIRRVTSCILPDLTSLHRRRVTSCTVLPDYMTSLHGRVMPRVLQHDHMSPFTEDMWRSVFY
jgi:hypothetical protein